jgi:gamma-glutamylputrescine oxidase
MKDKIFPQDQNFWYLKRPDILPLQADKETEVVIIGGGMAGLTAAQAFAGKGKKVILLEAFYCGAGASGKSSGFITPNAEVSLSEFIYRYGEDGGKIIWDAIEKQGVEHIRSNIKKYDIDCDYTEEDSLEVASSEKDVKDIIQESENLAKYGYTTSFVKKEDLPDLIGSKKYYAGVIYSKSFGINAYKYCQAMKKILMEEGVEIYEESPALSIQENTVTTLHATIKTDYIIVCADRFIPKLGKLTKEIYHAQNFLLVSEALPQDVIQKMFPQNRLMVWDTDLIYQFYRMTKDRLLMGGGSLLNIYDSHETHHSHYMYKKLTTYIADIFPDITIQFEQMWPGFIGISKDIAPLAGYDKDLKSIYYIGAVAGLPLAAMLGNYCADHILDGADTLKDYFSPYRKFPIGGVAQNILGTKLSFALSNWLSHGKT